MTTYVRRRLKRLDIYTDGACSGSPGPGGWAWAYEKDGSWVHDSGGERSTTNQRMEMTAAWKAVASNPGPLRICTDSAYVMNCFTQQWYLGWRDGRKRNGDPVANWDIWWRFITLVNSRDVTWLKVKGHSGDPGNDFVDRLAVQAKKSLTQTS